MAVNRDPLPDQSERPLTGSVWVGGGKTVKVGAPEFDAYGLIASELVGGKGLAARFYVKAEDFGSRLQQVAFSDWCPVCGAGCVEDHNA